MDIHGIAPYRQFHLVSDDGTQMILELKSDPETYAQYPRNFVFRIHYTLHENTLETIYEVENQDVCIEPWCSLPASENTITVFENQTDLIKLDPSNTYKNRWTIQIR